MTVSAYRYTSDSRDLYCKKCFSVAFPSSVPAIDEHRVIRREVLLGRECRYCKKPFLKGAKDGK